MNSLRFSGSACPDTCSADTVVPRTTNMSQPASTTVFANSLVRCGDSEPAEAAQRDRRLRRHHRVHRGGHDRQLEAVGVDLPGHRHLLRVAGAAGRHDRDVVEGVGVPAALGLADLEFLHAASLTGGGDAQPAEADRRPSQRSSTASTSATGVHISTAAAIWPPRKPSSGSLESITGSVSLRVLRLSWLLKMKSFQEATNTSAVVPAIPGRAIGMTTRTTRCTVPAPSISAASSTSRGTARKA